VHLKITAKARRLDRRAVELEERRRAAQRVAGIRLLARLAEPRDLAAALPQAASTVGDRPS
jgi:hypothetical protein